LDIAVGNGVSTLVVFQMLFNLIPHYIGLALPMALFLGVLLAFRKLSMQSELDAIQSTGIGLKRFIRSAMWLALLMTALNLLLAGWIQPYTRYAYRAILFNLEEGVIERGVGEGVFLNLPNGYTLRVEQSRGAGRELFGVFAHKKEADGRIITLTAKRGELFTGAMDGTVTLRLYEGNRSEWNPDSKENATLRFQMFDWPLNLQDLVKFRSRGGDERELTLLELWNAHRANVIAGRSGTTPAPVYGLPPELELPPSAVGSEFHFRVVFALSMLLLPIMAAPLGIVTHRASRSFGLVVGLIALVSYHKVLEFGDAYASVSGVPAGLVLWSAFGVFAYLVITLFRRTDAKAGATPMQALEAKWGDFFSSITRVFRSKPKQQGAS